MTARIIMPRTLASPAPYGSLLKRPRIERPGQRQFRTGGSAKDESYLALIRQLPCLRCGLENMSEPAHVRMNSAALGKYQALGQKPADTYTVPLCAGCHRTDHDSQHRVGEDTFWRHVGLNPLLVCDRLQRASPDVVAMRAVIFRCTEERRSDL